MNILIFLYTLLVAYWSDALLVIVVAGVLAYLYRRGKKDLVKDILYSLIVKAEKELGGATGGAKYSQVIASLYEKLPILLRLLFSKTVISKYIEDLVIVLKEKLKNPDVTLLSYDQEALVKATEAAPTVNSTETVVITPTKKYVADDGTELTPVIVIPEATITV